ncbi:hypothetical protein SDC9_106261 [bioreactor metagenome]|uniref:Uncharacterized protein n=1 Tax=bioreactor metagenome TaxID=1076179 RepID=A0A645B1Z2_9ZZZZ
MLAAQRRPVTVATGAHVGRSQTAIHQQHGLRLVGGQLDGLVQQRLVGHDLAAARARVGRHDHGRLGILDARGQRGRRKTAEHHRVDGANARAGQHGKCGFGDHRHVDQHAITLLDAQRLQAGSHALHFLVQFGVAIGALGVGFGGDGDQRVLVGTLGQMAVHRVVAQIGGATHEPARERRVAVVADLLGLGLPFDELGLFGPEGIAIFNRAAMEFRKTRHWNSLLIRPTGLPNWSGKPADFIMSKRVFVKLTF